MDITPCGGCGACQSNRSFECVHRDDMDTLYPLLRECNALVLASPIYFFNMSGQMKTFIDRCYASDKPEGVPASGSGAPPCA